MKAKIVLIHHMMILVLIVGLIIPSQLCLADMVYFKNGRKVEGSVERSEQGIWVEGVLFKQDEIERIEKTAPKVDKSQQKPWYEPFLTKMGLTAGPTDSTGATNSQQKIPVSNQANQKAPSPSMGQQPMAIPMPIPMPFQATPTSTQQGIAPQQGAVPFNTFDSRNFGQMMAEAQRLQNEAHQRQVQMMQEIQRAEEGGYDYGDGSYDPRDSLKDYEQGRDNRNYDDQRRSYPKDSDDYGRDGYDYEKEQKSKKRFKSIKVDEYGDVSWE